MKKFNVPQRKYCSGDTKMVSFRMHKKLWERVDKLAQEKNWNVTDLVLLVLDQYVQFEEKEK